MGIFEDFGPLKAVIPINDGKHPSAYGFLKNTKSTDSTYEHPDEVDVAVFSNKEFKTGDEVAVSIIGMFIREDGDHKVLARDESFEAEAFEDLPPDLQKVMLDFHGFKHKITSIENKESALKYLAGTHTI
jgi:inorganic pyrophosphatase